MPSLSQSNAGLIAEMIGPVATDKDARAFIFAARMLGFTNTDDIDETTWRVIVDEVCAD